MRSAIIVGAGPNGLAAAAELARRGWRTTVFEARETVGGGTRTSELTLPGFAHDVCSAVHPLGAGSPFFRSLPLEQHGLEWVQPEAPLAHPLDGGDAVLMHRSLEETAAGLGPDGPAYERLMRPFTQHWEELAGGVLGPVLRLPRHPLLMAGFGLRAMRSLDGLARSVFRQERARALLAGLSAHANLPLDYPFTAAFGLMLGAAGHAVGWPLARGGSQAIADALASYLRSLGGEVITGRRIGSLDELPAADATLLDLTPRQVVAVAGSQLPHSYRRELERFRYGPGVFKLDMALDGPIPWSSRDCARSATLHLGGTMAEMAAAERAVKAGLHPLRPYVLLAQPCLFDPSRAPEGKQTVWAYTHVPPGSTFDMTERIESQIERFAPGFRQRILARYTITPAELESYNENCVGGDIGGGSMEGLQLFMRPAVRLNQYATPVRGLYVCSSSTPPGGGVHGMCGYHAAQTVLKRHG